MIKGFRSRIKEGKRGLQKAKEKASQGMERQKKRHEEWLETGLRGSLHNNYLEFQSQLSNIDYYYLLSSLPSE